MHIQAQHEILASLPQASQVTRFMMRRELKGYDVADYIEVPSMHAAKSFSSWPGLAHKVFLNSYGVDLNQFPLRIGALPAEPTVLFVGNWAYQKGVDVLAEAIAEMNDVRLIHVGALLDAPFPTNTRFVHHDPIPQWELKKFYGAAHVFALASRQDGFGMVLSRASCHRPFGRLYGTYRWPRSCAPARISRFIRVVQSGDALALRRALTQALDDTIGKGRVAPITEAERQALSWRAYALRDLQFMSKILQSCPPFTAET